MFSIIFLVLVAQVVVASDQGDRVLVVPGYRFSEEELEKTLYDLGLLSDPAVEIPAPRTQHFKRKRGPNGVNEAQQQRHHSASGEGCMSDALENFQNIDHILNPENDPVGSLLNPEEANDHALRGMSDGDQNSSDGKSDDQIGRALNVPGCRFSEEELEKTIYGLELLSNHAPKIPTSQSLQVRPKRGPNVPKITQHICFQDSCLKKECPGKSDLNKAKNAEMPEMCNIKHLDISKNGLVSFSIELPEKLKFLHVLDLSDNSLGEIPNLRSLTSLIMLSFRNNEVTIFDPANTLPTKCLKIIDLMSNKINEIRIDKGGWCMDDNTYNVLNLDNNPLSQCCFDALCNPIVGNESRFCLELFDARKAIELDPVKLRSAFPYGGMIDLGGELRLSKDELSKFKVLLNAGRKGLPRIDRGGTIVRNGIYKRTLDISINFPYCDGPQRIGKPLVVAGLPDFVSLCSKKLHDGADEVDTEGEFDPAVPTCDHALTVHTFRSPMSNALRAFHSIDHMINSEEDTESDNLLSGLSDGDQNASGVGSDSPVAKRIRTEQMGAAETAGALVLLAQKSMHRGMLQ